MDNRKIIFVYNAKSNLFSMLTDYVHKALASSTYQCSLCSLTYSNLGMKKQWKEFIERLQGEKLFLYKDNFLKKYPEHSTSILPAIFIEKNGKLHELLTADELNSFHSLTELQNALTQKMNKA
jgi:hypothetical protein